MEEVVPVFRGLGRLPPPPPPMRLKDEGAWHGLVWWKRSWADREAGAEALGRHSAERVPAVNGLGVAAGEVGSVTPGPLH